MATATAYAAIRDDSSSQRSLSKNEKSFVRSLVSTESRSSVIRSDGRKAGEYRPIRLAFGRSHGTSECTVQLGSKTRVTACVGCDLIAPPNLDRPNDGVIRFGVDLSPMASASFEATSGLSTTTSGGGGGDGGGGGGMTPDGEQKLMSNRILRTLERTVLSGGVLDAEALCVRSGRFVWRLSVDVVALDDGGNLMDASILAVSAALRHFRLPDVDIIDDQTATDPDDDGGRYNRSHTGANIISSDDREPRPLPLHHTPLGATFSIFADSTAATTAAVAAISDPSDREELVANGTVTFGFNKHGELCGLDFPGGCELRPSQLTQCAGLARKRATTLSELLEDALSEADAKAQDERMTRLRRVAEAPMTGANNQNAMDVDSKQTTDEQMKGVAYGEMQGEAHVPNAITSQNDAAAMVAAIPQDNNDDEEDQEEYRKRALDYSLGHIPMKVRENRSTASDKTKNRRAHQGRVALGTSLMEAMVQSASSTQQQTHEDKNVVAAAPASSDVVDMDVDDDDKNITKIAEKTNRPAPMSLNRTDEADDEFDKLARSAADSEPHIATDTKTVPSKKDIFIDSDDEEAQTTTLQSEFTSKTQSAAAPTDIKPKKENNAVVVDDDDDVDDLVMAVKKKGKKKKSKQKKTK